MRTILITGATNGIGLEAAARLATLAAEFGHDDVALAIRDDAKRRLDDGRVLGERGGRPVDRNPHQPEGRCGGTRRRGGEHRRKR